MPRARQYPDAAARQAAYRRRLATSQAAAAAPSQRDGLGATPGYPRWRGLLRPAHELLTTVTSEMDTYYRERSDQWQESARGEAFLDRLENLQEAEALLEEHRS